jgi:hypothetical protein
VMFHSYFTRGYQAFSLLAIKLADVGPGLKSLADFQA